MLQETAKESERGRSARSNRAFPHQPVRNVIVAFGQLIRSGRDRDLSVLCWRSFRFSNLGFEFVFFVKLRGVKRTKS